MNVIQRGWNGRRPFAVALFGVLLACGLTAVSVNAARERQGTRAPSPAELYQQAMHQEDAVGNVEAAIDLYRRVLAAKPDRATAAKAQLRIGLCLEKLGRPEARQAFDVVVRDYADQTAVVAEARTRLARQTSAAGSAVAGTGVNAIQLWSGGDIEGDAALSSDGRHLVYSSWAENGNLLLKDLTTGTVRPITRDAAVRTKGTPQPWSPAFSPDGSRIAYPWYDGLGSEFQSSLRIVDRDGSNLRVLASAVGADLVYDWSPDGRSIAINLYATGQSRIAIVSVTDGSVVPLKSTGWQKASGVRFSPDGKFLVYSLRAAQDSPDRRVFVLAIDGGTEAGLTDGTSPAWTPDGRAVVFFSDRSGTSDLWMIPVTNGRPNGDPAILRRNVGGTNHGFIRDGSLFYETRSQGRDLLVARIDPAAGRVADPVNLTNAFVGSNGGGFWSPDGRQVAFARGTDRGATKIVIRTVATGEERTLPVTLDDGLFGHNQGIRWVSGGRALLVRGGGNGRISFKRIDVETGSQQMLFEAPIAAWARGFEVSADGRVLYYTHRNDTGVGGVSLTVVKRNLETGEESDEYRPEGTGGVDLALSPDGTRLAIRGFPSGRLVVQPTAGGAPTEIQQGPESLQPLAWTRDGRFILGTRSKDELEHLWAVPSSGGTAVDLGISADNILHASVSPVDGRVVISVTRPSHELWLLRNLLKSSTAR